MPHTYLTKSKFKTALECPRKLYYGQQPTEFPNAKTSDAFLQQLAEGGFQVGELAKDYYPGGTEIKRGSHQQMSAQTQALLQQENCTIYEAAFLWNNCFVLVDVLVKKGHQIELIEVKAKGYHPQEDHFWGKKEADQLATNWVPYLYDVAFQTYVVQNYLQANGTPNPSVAPYLCLADKSAVASANGLNQLYQLVAIDSDGNKKVQKNADASLYTAEKLGNRLLYQVSVAKEVAHIIQFGEVNKLSFTDAVAQFSQNLQNIHQNEAFFTGKIQKTPCKTCEFSLAKDAQHKSGKDRCLQQLAHFTDADFSKALVWDIWNFRKADDLIQDQRYFINQVTASDFAPKNASKQATLGMSTSERQEMQALLHQQNSRTPYVLKNELNKEIQSWQFPLHFIDFEGTRTALPFYAGMRPYEQVAFQFSHHIVHQNGQIEHATEWLNMEPGFFPNFDFVRALKKALSNDEGTVFKYATYENTVLNCIATQLEKSDEPDKEALIDFILSITNQKVNGKSVNGYRDMVDLCAVIKRYYYHPLTKGSNSIKYVLPAILNTNTRLQQTYAQPIYGSNAMKSKNFENQIWIQKDENGQIKDPYKLLHNIYEGKIDINVDEEGDASNGLAVANGGAAMAAYNEIQFASTTPERRDTLRKQLLRYCELDTLAMVLVYEELKDSARK